MRWRMRKRERTIIEGDFRKGLKIPFLRERERERNHGKRPPRRDAPDSPERLDRWCLLKLRNPWDLFFSIYPSSFLAVKLLPSTILRAFHHFFSLNESSILCITRWMIRSPSTREAYIDWWKMKRRSTIMRTPPNNEKTMRAVGKYFLLGDVCVFSAFGFAEAHFSYLSRVSWSKDAGFGFSRLIKDYN